MQQPDRARPPREPDALTIVATSATEVMRQFARRGLAARGYAIAGPIVPTCFALCAGETSSDLFGGTPMLAGTFVRCPRPARAG